MPNSSQTYNARAQNPRHAIHAARLAANYRPGQVCANCLDYDSGRCSRMHCQVKRTTLCDHLRPVPVTLREGSNEADLHEVAE